jgi:WD40 repeat protein
VAVLAGHTDGVNAAAFSSEGSRIVTASADNTARVWDASTGALDAVLAGHTDRVLGAAFSRDNSRMVTASADDTARIWDAATGAALATLRGHAGAVAAAAFGADGSRIVTASADRTARVWQLDPLVLMPADQRQSYICRERLIGARSFTDREMQEAMLRGRDDLRHPCDRVGPFSLAYYRQAAARAGAALRRAFSN